MRLKPIAATITLLFGVIMAGGASASGFQLLEQNASGLGNAYAGSAAVADNASTIYFNPAGMTHLKAHEVSVGVNAIAPSYKFTDSGSSTGTLAGNGGDAGTTGYVPNLYSSFALNDKVYFGLGISAPFGMKTEYDAPWLGGAQSQRFEVKTLNVNPALAFKINEKLSLGVGVNWQKLEVGYDRAVATGLPYSRLGASLDADSSAWGWNVGALADLSETMKVGVSYRSQIKHQLKGTLTAAGSAVDASADVTLPATLIMSVAQQVTDRWEALGDLSWTQWSSIPRVDIMRASGALSGTVAQTLNTDFRDNWRLALGANYKVNDAWKVKYGVAYDQSPVRGASTRLVSLPDNDRLWFSVGAQWKIATQSTLDLGLAYLHVRDAKIDNDQTSAQALSNRGRVTGEYSGSIWVLGLQYSAAF